MIKELFLPEKIGTKRLFSQKIISMFIDEQEVYGALAYAKTDKTIVQNSVVFSHSCEQASIIAALKHVIQALGSYDQLRIALPASQVVFKELEIPFVDHEKIRMVLDYELEPMLPFSIDDAVVDFIITGFVEERKSSEVLVAAVRKQDLAQILNTYRQAGIEPTSITIDLLAVYGLYLQTIDPSVSQKGCALIDVGQNTTRISFLCDGQLKLTRHIQKGLADIIKQTSAETGVEEKIVRDRLALSGFKTIGDAAYDKALSDHVINFFNDIQFTLNSFSLKLNYYDGVTKIVFLGDIEQVHDFVVFSSNALQIPCELFHLEKLFHQKGYYNKVARAPESWLPYLTALGTALIHPAQDDFDLRRKEFVLVEDRLWYKQGITACVLFVSLFILVGVQGYRQMSMLKQKLLQIEGEKAKPLLGFLSAKEKVPGVRLHSIVSKAERLLKEKQSSWAPFTTERIQPLDVLFELTMIMDKRQFNVDLEECVVTPRDAENILVEIVGFFASEKGGGKHYQDWGLLERRFAESKIFSLVSDPVMTSVEARGIRFAIRLQKRTSV